jgi:hypothetical protein
MKGLTWYNSVNLTGLENIVSLKKNQDEIFKKYGDGNIFDRPRSI